MMKLSTKGRYATRIMVYLASKNDDLPTRKDEISKAEGISSDYIEQILTKLRTAGLVISRRGVKGGFTLARSADKITVFDVLVAAEGPVNVVPCLKEKCERISICVTRPIWAKANEVLKDLFSGITIEQLADEAKNTRDNMCLSFEI